MLIVSALQCSSQAITISSHYDMGKHELKADQEIIREKQQIAPHSDPKTRLTVTTSLDIQ
jgi:hypothetical protein